MTEDLDIAAPAFTEELGEALLVGWAVAPGDRVTRGQKLAEIETDKASTELTAPQGGTITALLVPAGTILRAGQLVYRLRPLAADPAIA